jgi:hypothetical protein
LQQEGGSTWDKHRIQLVWDAIALHTVTTVFPHKEVEVALTATGTMTELTGPEIAKQMLVCPHPSTASSSYLFWSTR